jgi:TctA family transporter
MAQQGRAGAALATAAIASFVAGTVATFVIAFLAPPLAGVALEFKAWEYFSLMVLGLVASIVLAQGSLLKALGMVVLGLLLGLVGRDVTSGSARFAFDVPELKDGINFVVVAMGVFGVAEIVRNLENERTRQVLAARIGRLMPTREDIRRILAPIVRGTTLGSALGILPGGGALLASFAAYALEKKVSPRADEFGKGAIEGVAAPEAANNAGAQTSFIPMLTLGIPSNPVMALMIGALILHSIRPGPNVMVEQPRLFWGVIVSMWIGNLFLLVMNLPLIGLWVRMLAVPYQLLYPAILVFASVGVLSLSNTTFDVHLMALFGVLGYVLVKLDCEPAPLLLGYILGPLMEEYLLRAMTLSRGDPTTFLQRPISAVMLGVALLALVAAVLPAVSRRRARAFAE